MRVLITGITGFVGSHLAEHALERGAEVHGTVRWRSRMDNVEHVVDRLQLHDCDLRDAHAVDAVIDRIRPERIFHLAAQSYVPTSWTAPRETLTDNVVCQLNLLEALRRHDHDAPIQVAGSSEEYGLVHPDETPITEDNPLRPLSPYAVSKVGQDLLAYQYFRSYGSRVVRTRAFNHTGPRRGEVFVTSNFAQQIARIEAGLQDPVIRVGNLEAERDFLDVRDVVRAYWVSLERCEFGEVYNIASGVAWRIRAILDLLLAQTDREIDVEEDPARLRPSDVELLVGDGSRFHEATGWEPRIPFERTVRDLLDYWRERV